jgi:hypothetical protein
VPPRVPVTPDEQRRHAAAQVRRELRQQMAERQAALRQPPG